MPESFVFKNKLTKFAPNSKKQNMKLRNILLAAALPVSAFLASCGGDDVKTAPKPTMTLQSGAGFTATNKDSYFDSSVKVGLRAFSNDEKLTSVSIKISTNGSTPATLWDSTFSSKTLNYDYTYKVAGGVGDVQVLTFTAVDKNGESASTTLTVSILPASNSLGLTAGQQVFNVIGAGLGAYDLNASQNVAAASTETKKDLKDMTPASGIFPKTWTSGNGTKFVKVTANDWNNATSTDYLWNLWKSSGASAITTTPVLVANEIWLVKTGQALAFNIYLLKITEVKETSADNNDYIKFDYKGL